MISLEGQVAIITGGAQGIGEGICKVFCEAGATVALWDVRDSGAETASKIKAEGGKIFFQKVDVTNRKLVDAAVEEIIQQHSKIDILINNAGVLRDKSFLKMTQEEWDTADEDQRLDLLLQAYKDPDDVDGLQFEDFKDLPDVATSNMYIEPDVDIISEAEQVQFSNAEIVEEFGGNENNYKVDSEESAKRYIKNWAKILKKGYFPPGLVNITTLNSVINKSFSDKAGYDSAFRTKLRTLAKKEFQGYKFKDSKTFDEFMKLNGYQKSKCFFCFDLL